MLKFAGTKLDTGARVHEEVEHDGFRFVLASDGQKIVGRSSKGTLPWIITAAPYTAFAFSLIFLSSAKNDFSSPNFNLVEDCDYAWLLTTDEARELAEGLIAYANGMEGRGDESPTGLAFHDGTYIPTGETVD